MGLLSKAKSSISKVIKKGGALKSVASKVTTKATTAVKKVAGSKVTAKATSAVKKVAGSKVAGIATKAVKNKALVKKTIASLPVVGDAVQYADLAKEVKKTISKPKTAKPKAGQPIKEKATTPKKAGAKTSNSKPRGQSTMKSKSIRSLLYKAINKKAKSAIRMGQLKRAKKLLNMKRA